MLLSVRSLALLATCALCVQAQLAETDEFLTSRDSPQLVLEDDDTTYTASSYLGGSFMDHIRVDFFHCLANIRDWLGWMEDSYSFTMVSNTPERAPPLVEPRLIYSQTCSIKTFNKTRRVKAFNSTLSKCKNFLQFTRSKPMHNETLHVEEGPVVFRGCCRARHYGVLETCIKMTFDGSNPENLLDATWLCKGKTIKDFQSAHEPWNFRQPEVEL